MHFKLPAFYLSLLIAAITPTVLGSTITVGFFDSAMMKPKFDELDTYKKIVLIEQVSETLVDNDPFGRIVPGIAKAWHISPDGKTYSFTINEKKRLSNGEKITASSMITFYNRIIGSNRHPMSRVLRSIIGCEETDLSGGCPKIEKIGEYEFKVYLKKIYPGMLQVLSSPMLSYFVSGKDGLPIGSGPLKYEVKNDDSYLIPNPKYTGVTVGSTRIKIRASVEDQKTNPVDYAILSRSELTKFDSNEYQVYFQKEIANSLIYINPNKGFSIQERKDIATLFMCLNLKEFMGNIGEPLNSIFPPGLLPAIKETYSKKPDCKRYSEKKQPPVITVATYGKFPYAEEISSRVKNLFNRSLSFTVAELSTDWFRSLVKTNTDVFILKWKSPFLDPDSVLIPFRELGYFNSSNTLKSILAELDNSSIAFIPLNRAQKFRLIEKYLLENFYAIPLVQPHRIKVARKGKQAPKSRFSFSDRFTDL
ncbi:MAG: hypothetical protein HRU19_31200 [Pseudobacteriovorax sp.]|nr:hypothetical protein [Pseudobacteriovorax sp.]